MSIPQTVEVTVEQGLLRGERVPAHDDSPPYDAFRGIPYAQKPVGPLRFRAPRPPKSWKGVRLALEEGSMAPQLGPGGKAVGNEDCLYLNVYTPKVPSSAGSRSAGSPWPIMFWLHPGAFISGSSSATEYGPELLVAKNVVVITVNYRLGPFGFLSLGSPAATGNYGLKDMVAALRWVNKNGGAFGGDVQQITIFGCSAGGAAVQHLQLAPSAKGLFHRAIAQSGSALCPWACISDARSRALRLVRTLGASESDLADDDAVLSFLRKLPAEAIVEATAKVPPEPTDSPLSLMVLNLPTSEEGLVPDDPDDEIFLPGHPRDLIKQGRITDVPLIMGFNDAEGLLVDVVSVMATVRAIPEVLANYDANLQLGIPLELRPYFPDASKKQKDAVERIRGVYFNGGPVSPATRNSFYKLMGDILFSIPAWQEARRHAHQSNHPVYFYNFAVKGKINKVSNRLKPRSEDLPGACHADEINYLWTSKPPMPPLPKLEPGSLEAQTRHRMVTLWTNFAKTGNPTPEGETTLGGIRWPTVPKNLPTYVPYLHIGETLSIPTVGVYRERQEVWNSLYSDFSEDTQPKEA